MKSMLRTCLIIAVIFTSCDKRRIVEKPILFDELRRDLSLEYMNERYGMVKPEPTIEPIMIVVHWTQIPTFDQSFDAFYRPTLEDSRPDIAGAGSLNVSAHYLVDRNGVIYHLMPDTLMARHVIGLNHVAIGIENVGGTEETPLTDAQFDANRWLIRELANQYEIQYLIGHYEYPLFEGHELWLEKDPDYRTVKVDPGEDFMARLRDDLADLAFQPIPED